MPVTGFLHQADINLPYALAGTPRAKDCEVEVKKGIHLTAYVKDVFPNAGRMTLSLDPKINKNKVGWVGAWAGGRVGGWVAVQKGGGVAVPPDFPRRHGCIFFLF